MPADSFIMLMTSKSLSLVPFSPALSQMFIAFDMVSMTSQGATPPPFYCVYMAFYGLLSVPLCICMGQGIKAVFKPFKWFYNSLLGVCLPSCLCPHCVEWFGVSVGRCLNCIYRKPFGGFAPPKALRKGWKLQKIDFVYISIF